MKGTVWVDEVRPSCGCVVWHTCKMVECRSCKGEGGRNVNPSGWYWVDCYTCRGAGVVPPVAEVEGGAG